MINVREMDPKKLDQVCEVAIWWKRVKERTVPCFLPASVMESP